MNETQLENLALEWFADNGWQTETGPEIAPDSDRPLSEDYKDVLLEEPLKRAIQRINLNLPDKQKAAMKQADEWTQLFF